MEMNCTKTLFLPSKKRGKREEGGDSHIELSFSLSLSLLALANVGIYFSKAARLSISLESSCCTGCIAGPKGFEKERRERERERTEAEK